MKAAAAVLAGGAGLAVLATVSSCAGVGDGAPSPDVADSLRVTSPAFTPGGRLPARYSCDGAAVSPPLSWTGAPSDTRGFAVVVDDPNAPGGTFVHWVLLNVPADVTSVSTGSVPEGAVQARNTLSRTSYFAPCPPDDGVHHYRFTVYALGKPVRLGPQPDLTDALAAISHDALAQGRIVATYRRSG
ncbi:MAG TPA: YbhB/YbcL family Raf kinase inhibitor-like protein [Nocardioidaceae bacterium]|nr:YbhB/YbcL family Raf kinase inhibitor-like protein [Nocardioidaceae bacterium]